MKYVLIALLSVVAGINTSAQCVMNPGVTMDPLPVNNVYAPGTTVTFTLTFSYNQVGSNWMHSVLPLYGSGWDMNTLQAVSLPVGGNGSWQHFQSVFSNATSQTFGQGFYYSVGTDNNPGNNFGYNCSGCFHTFVWQITTNGTASLSNGFVAVYSDGMTGAWAGGAGDCLEQFTAFDDMMGSGCTAAFLAVNPIIGFPVNFLSTSNIASLDSLRWWIDDDLTSNSSSIETVFYSTGSHQVCLAIYDTTGCVDTTCLSLQVQQNVFASADYTIAGNVFYDLNEDGIKQPDDFSISTPLLLEPTGTIVYSHASAGTFVFYVDSGQYHLQPADVYGSTFHFTTSIPDTIQVDSMPVFLGDVGVAADAPFFLPQVFTNSSFSCFTGSQVWLDIHNVSLSPVSVKIKALFNSNLPSSLLLSPAAPPDSVVNDTLFATLSFIGPFSQDEFSFYIANNIVPGDSISWQMWYTITDTAGTQSVSGYLASSNIAMCAYDPNEKLVLPKNNTVENFMPRNTSLTYSIHFQNTGNMTATNVTLVDTISEFLDLSTFVTLEGTNAYSVCIDDNVLKIAFPNIMLPDSGSDYPGSQGHFTFGIRHKDNLPNLTAIENFADIYFDDNPPVRTNKTTNTILDPANTVLKITTNPFFTLYPNPASDITTISLPHSAKATISIYDALGRLMLVVNSDDNKTLTVPLTGFATGVYVISISTSESVTQCKLVKQ